MRKLFLLAVALVFAACNGDAQLMVANRPISAIKLQPDTVSARGGAMLTLTGLGFTAESVVEIDGQVVPSTFDSSTELLVKAPPLYAGRAPVLVIEGTQFRSEVLGGLEVLPLRLRFVEAPPHSLALAATDLTTAAAADVDGDGDTDLLTCGAACVLSLNDGHGNFDLPAANGDAGADAGISLPSWPAGARFLALEDLDADGDPDLLMAFPDGGAIYANQSGHFTSASTWRLPAGTEVTVQGDLDGDGKLELISAGGGQLHVAFNFGALRFDERDAGTLPLATTRSLVVADVNADGQLDVIAATAELHDGVALRLFLNSHGKLTEVPGGLPGGPVRPVTALAAGDVNADGFVDLIAVGPGQDRLLLNDGQAHFFDATNTLMPVDASAGTSVALVDLDRDHHLDLLIGNAGATTRLYVNDGTGRFVDRTLLLPVRPETTACVAAADLDGDGDADLLVLPSAADQAHLYLSVEPAP